MRCGAVIGGRLLGHDLGEPQQRAARQERDGQAGKACFGTGQVVRPEDGRECQRRTPCAT